MSNTYKDAASRREAYRQASGVTHQIDRTVAERTGVADARESLGNLGHRTAGAFGNKASRGYKHEK